MLAELNEMVQYEVSENSCWCIVQIKQFSGPAAPFGWLVMLSLGDDRKQNFGQCVTGHGAARIDRNGTVLFLKTRDT